ncbi:MAG: hypothetical protein Q9169_007569, partial [Polycauliona sp. 2 TL-2023]
MFVSSNAPRLYQFVLLLSFYFACYAQLAKRQETIVPIRQISDGQVQVPRIVSKTTIITEVRGVLKTILIPAHNAIESTTTFPVNVNGQPAFAVIDPTGIISFLPPNDLLIGTSVITANPTGFRIGTQEVASGKPAVTVAGQTFSFGSQGLYVNGIPKSLTGTEAIADDPGEVEPTPGNTPSIPGSAQVEPTPVNTPSSSGNGDDVGTTTNSASRQTTTVPAEVEDPFDTTVVDEEPIDTSLGDVLSSSANQAQIGATTNPSSFQTTTVPAENEDPFDTTVVGEEPIDTSLMDVVSSSRNDEQVVTTTNLGSSQSTIAPVIIVVGGETIQPSATGFIVGGQTVLPGSSAVTVSGQTLSLGTGGTLVNDGTTIPLPVNPGGIPAQTTNNPVATPASITGGANQPPRTTTGSAQAQSSILNATGSDGPSITTLVFGGQTEVFARETFSDLADLTSTTTVQTSVENDDGGWITGVPIIVLPGGVWWHGGLNLPGGGGGGGGGGFCFWPFCPPGGPPGGGGSSSDAGGGGNPEENPNEEEEEEEPEESQQPSTEPEESQAQSTEPPSSTPSSSSVQSSSVQSSSVQSSNYATITLDGDPMPYVNDEGARRAWGDIVYARMVADGLGEDVTGIGGVYSGATGTPLNSAELGVPITGRTGSSSGATSTGPTTTNVKLLSDCDLTTSVVSTTDASLTTGTYTICECANEIIAGTTSELGSSGTTYVICSGAPNPTVSTIINPSDPSESRNEPSEPNPTSTRYVPPAWQCPNDGVRQNAPGCPTPTTSTGGPLSCGTGSNVGVATYNPATWCGCNGDIYPTISGATSDYCAYTTVPESTINPTVIPPIPGTPTEPWRPPTVTVTPDPTADCHRWYDPFWYHFE